MVFDQSKGGTLSECREHTEVAEAEQAQIER